MKAKDRKKQNKQGCCAGCGRSAKLNDSYAINSLEVMPAGYDKDKQYNGGYPKPIVHRPDDYTHRSNGPSSPPSPVCLRQYASRFVDTKVPGEKPYKSGVIITINGEHTIEVKR